MNNYWRQRRNAVLHPAIPRRIYRDRSCPFDTLTDIEFRKRYRFTRAGFFKVVDLIGNDIEPVTRRSSSLTTAHKLALTLQMLSSNSFQISSGDLAGVHQCTVSRVVREVTDWFSSNCDRFVHYHDRESLREMQKRVFVKTNLPGIAGAVDGTHIRIIAPSEHEDQFVNRKGYHSLNVGAMVDDELRFMWFSANWPGRAHDARIWRESQIYADLLRGEKSGIIVGDSAYGAEKFLIKIFPGNNLSEAQVRYNEAVCKFRVVVENGFGVLKRQFHCLHGELRYSPQRAGKIVATAICLRNCAIDLKEPVDYDDVDWDPTELRDALGETFNDPPNGFVTMRNIVNKFFS